jgi:hypothetical protein
MFVSGSSALACVLAPNDDEDGDWGDRLMLTLSLGVGFFSPAVAAFSRRFASFQSLLSMTHNASRLNRRARTHQCPNQMEESKRRARTPPTT